jgi:nicotinate-nucleotide adenylyltransferase
MNILLYFGSFNPIHTGHLIIAETALQQTGADEVWMVVSPQSPFKQLDELMPAAQRLEMASLATSNNPRIKVCDIEFQLPTPSYTIDTLKALKESFPEYIFSILMGADNVSGLPRWKSFEALINQHHIYIYRRTSEETEMPIEHIHLHLIQGPMLDISSTYIRKCLQDGKSIRYLVPESIITLLQPPIN